MGKMILEHISKQDIPAKWVKLLDDSLPSTYRITIEPENKPSLTSEAKNKKSWADMPMFGMWKDKDDLNNPADYVRQLRRPRF